MAMLKNFDFVIVAIRSCGPYSGHLPAFRCHLPRIDGANCERWSHLRKETQQYRPSAFRHQSAEWSSGVRRNAGFFHVAAHPGALSADFLLGIFSWVNDSTKLASCKANFFQTGIDGFRLGMSLLKFAKKSDDGIRRNSHHLAYYDRYFEKFKSTTTAKCLVIPTSESSRQAIEKTQ